MNGKMEIEVKYPALISSNTAEIAQLACPRRDHKDVYRIAGVWVDPLTKSNWYVYELWAMLPDPDFDW